LSLGVLGGLEQPEREVSCLVDAQVGERVGHGMVLAVPGVDHARPVEHAHPDQ
jgi:hypothetical protein